VGERSDRTPRGVWWALGLAGLLVVVDQTSKLWIRNNLRLEQDRITIIPNFFDIVHVQNRGAAWGIMQNQTLFLAIISVLMLLLLVFFRRSILQDTYTHFLVYGLIISGIIGNLIDRLKFQSVTDFLDVHIYDKHWPVFNVADSAICIAVFLYIVTSWKKPPEPPHPLDEKT